MATITFSTPAEVIDSLIRESNLLGLRERAEYGPLEGETRNPLPDEGLEQYLAYCMGRRGRRAWFDHDARQVRWEGWPD